MGTPTYKPRLRPAAMHSALMESRAASNPTCTDGVTAASAADGPAAAVGGIPLEQAQPQQQSESLEAGPTPEEGGTNGMRDGSASATSAVPEQPAGPHTGSLVIQCN